LEELNKHLEGMALACVSNSIVGDQNIQGGHDNSINNINLKLEININPVNKLSLDHIDPSKMKELIETFDINAEKLNLLLGDYLKHLLCDKEHPENQAVKYIKKKPPTYNSLVEDKNGNKMNVIKGLKDTCELLSDPVLETLKSKLKECLKVYKKDESFDDGLYDDAIKELKKELNKDNVKKSLKSVLQNDILHDIEYKLVVE
jgi:RNA binding exosome subunit